MGVSFKIGKRRYAISSFALLFAASLFVSASIVFYAQYRYANTPYFHNFVFLAVLCFIVPVGGFIYYRHMQLQNKEYYFPQFLKDLADGARAGLSLPQAVMSVNKINYGTLTEDVKKLTTYISWGLPFDDALRRFADRTGSKMIRSSVDLIVEAYLAGGGIADILDTVAEDAGKIHTLREDRKTRFSGFISTIYSVYLVFLIVVVVMVNDLLPEIPTIPSFGSTRASVFGISGAYSDLSPRAIPEDELVAVFFNLAIIEAIFAGLLAGIAGEGNTIAGIKHAIILIFISVAVFQIFIPIPDPRDRIARAIAKMPVNIDASVAVGRFFLDSNVTSKDLVQHFEDYLQKMNLPTSGGKPNIQITEDPRGCTPCAEGAVQLRPDAITVLKPTYLSFRVVTDPILKAYMLYVS